MVGVLGLVGFGVVFLCRVVGVYVFSVLGLW